MKRREFIRNSAPALTLPALINGYTVKAFGPSPILDALMAATTVTDHVLVVIQLSGGNDGLNMVIPVDQYGNLANARGNILIPQNKVLTLTGLTATGLHPSMTGLQSLYNNGKLKIVQGVSYPTPSFSHFRATDIWTTASDSNQVLNSGWMGRYLGTEYPNFPTGYPNSTMPDPLAIQIGSSVSPAFMGPVMSMGMAITNPSSFYNIVNNVQDPAPSTPAGKELSYVRTIAKQTQAYLNVIKTAASNVTSQGAYPATNRQLNLGDQLKIVAQLIKGGLKTRLYMVTLGGFDTHASQVDTTDTTTGTHANLLKHLSDCVKAFMDDCNGLGIADRVVGMTFSEFGRRIKSNGSGGTDHGAAAPLFVFGNKVDGGKIIGTNPTIAANVSVNDNLPMQYDFRSVYASLLKDWLCVNGTDLNTIMLKNFQQLSLVNAPCMPSGLHTANQHAGINIISNYPNPFVSSTTITFTTEGGHTMVQVFDMMGREIRTLVNSDYTPGTYTVWFDATGLAPGNYYARLQNGMNQQVRNMAVVR
jgi:uncharacterized protein (DUF1501 family)